MCLKFVDYFRFIQCIHLERAILFIICEIEHVKLLTFRIYLMNLKCRG